MSIAWAYRGNTALPGAACRSAPSRQPGMPLLAELEDNLTCVTINMPLLTELVVRPGPLKYSIRPSRHANHVAMSPI
jgi:hypothetical protein